MSDRRVEDMSLQWASRCQAENKKRLAMMVNQLAVIPTHALTSTPSQSISEALRQRQGYRVTSKTLLEKLGQVVSGCEAKVATIGEQIVENERIKKDKSNPKYMRERAKDEKKKLEKEALPEATAALVEARGVFEQKKAEAEALIAHLEELVRASEAADAAANAFLAREIAWREALVHRTEASPPDT